MYGSMLSKLAQSAQPATLGMGNPPDMSGMGLPPPPTNIGAMPTGGSGTDAKGAADQAILALRDVQGHFPQLKTQIDGMIDSLKSATQQKAPPPPLGAATPPGAPAPSVSPTIESGSAGAA
ncbi:MAG: hypothetical protein KGL39_49245 [Patescibacteria group bacterium]|nr:hypothetical protein [Patescibacteria group bacterium]